MFDKTKEKIAEPDFQKGQELDSQHKYTDAMNSYRRAIAIYPRYLDAYYGLASDYYHIGNYNISLKIMKNILNMGFRLNNTYMYLGIIYDKLQDFTKAISNYKEVISINSQNNLQYNTCYIKLAKDYHRIKDYKSEIINYMQANRVIQADKFILRSRFLNNIGIAYGNLGNEKQASHFYKAAIHLNNKNDVLYSNLSMSYHNLQDYSDEVNALKQAVKLNPNKEEYYNRLGNAYNHLQDYNDEITALKQAIRLNPNKEEYYLSLGLAYYILGDDKQAIHFYKAAIRLDNKDDALYYAISLAYDKLQDYSNEITALKQAIKLNPHNNEYHEALKKNLKHIQDNFNFDNVDKYNKNIDYRTQLKRLVGLSDVYDQLSNLIYTYNVESVKFSGHKHGMIHLVFEGAPGTGKTLVAKLFSHLLAQKGIVQPNRYVEMNAANFSSKYQGQSVNKVKQAIKGSINGVLFIDEAYSLGSDESSVKEASNELLTDIQNHQSDIVVILAGYRDKMKNFFNSSNEGLSSRFPDVVTFPNYSNQDCLKIFYANLIQEKMKISSEDNTKEILNKDFINWISVDRREKGDSFGNARTVKNCCRKLVYNVDARVGRKYDGELNKLNQEDPDKLSTITVNDVRKTFNKNYKKSEKEKKHDYLKDLNSLIGLNSVKSQLQTEINRVKANKRLGNASGHGNINSIFEGNPGTGKTTVAKLLGKILYQKNIVQNDNFKHVNATKLQSTIVGGSAKRMRFYIQDAMGGVLFIDEAYALGGKYMQPVVETLLSAAEDYKNDLVIILAGYTKQMEDLRNYVNPGFKSRFRKVIKFPDYNSTECQQIFELFMRRNNLKFDIKATHVLLNKYLKQVISIKKSEDNSNFANARTVRNIYDDLQDTFDNRIAVMPESQFEQLKKNGSVKNITTKDVEKTFGKYNVTN